MRSVTRLTAFCQFLHLCDERRRKAGVHQLALVVLVAHGSRRSGPRAPLDDRQVACEQLFAFRSRPAAMGALAMQRTRQRSGCLIWSMQIMSSLY